MTVNIPTKVADDRDMGRRRMQIYLWKASLLILTSLLLVPYQNCTRSVVSFNSHDSTVYQGNGDAYEGRLTRYAQNETGAPCTEVGADGRPLPNALIYVVGEPPGHQAQIVRQNCQDLDSPIALDPALVQIGASGLTYAGRSYAQLQVTGDFDVVAPDCPAGHTPSARPARVNLIVGSQDFHDPHFDAEPGLTISLNGSLGGLPRFEVARGNANYMDWWRRVSQVLPLTAGKTYAYTFLAKPGTVGLAGFSFYQAMDYTFSLSVDLATGAVRDDGNVGVPSVTTVSRAFSGGRLVTIYFSTPKDAPYSGVGVYPSNATPGSTNLGDSIYATALELVDVSTFCTKP